MLISSRYRRGRRTYQTGGEAIGMLGELGTSVWDSFSPPDQYGYDENLAEKSTFKGITSGAAAGTAIMPGIGTVVGGVVGGISGLIGGNRQEKEALEAKNRAIVHRNDVLGRMGRARAIGYDFTGNQDGQLYALGGKLKALNSDTVEVDGQTHAEGGVQIGGNVEVEDKETISGDYVFSDLLGFAKPHKFIAKQIGKIEKKPINNERKTSLEILRKKEQVLKQTQEQVREDIGAELYDNINKQLGGNISSWNKHKNCGCH